MKTEKWVILFFFVMICLTEVAGAETPLVEPTGLQVRGVYLSGDILTYSYDDVQWYGESFQEGSIAYVIREDGSAQLISDDFCSSGIPEEVNGLKITAIGALVRYNFEQTQSGLEIPATVEQMAEFPYGHTFSRVDPKNTCFEICDSILYDIPGRRMVSYIPEDGQTSCTVRAGTQRIGSWAFSCEPGTSGGGYWSYMNRQELEEIILPDGLISIGECAFFGCEKLKTITIPDSVTAIDGNPFPYCDSLQEISISPDHPVFGLRDGILYRKSDFELICLLPGVDNGDFNIPEWINSLAPYAFAGSDLESITFPDNITSISRGAFRNTPLADIKWPKEIVSIGQEAFAQCGIANMDIPDSVTQIGAYAFISSAIEQIRLPAGLHELEDGLFANCYHLLNGFAIPDEVQTIGNNVLLNCDELEEIILPDTVVSIGTEAVSSCMNLKYIHIGAGLRCIEPNAFSWSDAMESISVSPDNPYLEVINGVLINLAEQRLIKRAGRSGSSSLEIPHGIMTIDDYAFEFCDDLTEIVIPDSVTSIGEGAFWCCFALTDITIPDSVRTIGSYAFFSCDLTNVIIPDSVVSIGPEAFYGVTLTVGPDSYAMQYCIDNWIDYTCDSSDETADEM